MAILTKRQSILTQDNINIVDIIYIKKYFFLFLLLIKINIKKYILKKFKKIVTECGLKSNLIKNKFVKNKKFKVQYSNL